ncbi:MAG: hypothetical protein ACOZBL_02840 [Patescibacteria group bacterium]
MRWRFFPFSLCKSICSPAHFFILKLNTIVYQYFEINQDKIIFFRDNVPRGLVPGQYQFVLTLSVFFFKILIICVYLFFNIIEMPSRIPFLKD